MSTSLTLTLVFGIVLGPSAPQSVHQGQPPYELSWGDCWDNAEFVTPTHFIQGGPAVRMYGKEVEFRFTMRASNATDPVIDSISIRNPVAFWPTAATYLAGGLYAVAGKREQQTVIELWQVPMPFPDAFPVGGTPTGFAGGGEVLYKATIYNTAIVGQDMVRLLAPNRGKPNSLFVQFYDSRDLYELNYTDGLPPGIDAPAYPLTKVLSATAGAGVPHVPALADSRLQFNSSNHHVIEGYVYMIFPSFDASVEAGLEGVTLEPLFLFDHDLDGTLDEYVTLSEAELQARSMWKAPDSYWVDRQHVTKMWPY